MANSETSLPRTRVRHLPDGSVEAYTPPICEEIDPGQNIVRLLEERVGRNPRQTIIERKVSMGREWQAISAKEFLDEVDSVARGLIGLGLKPGDRMATMAHTSYEWTLLDYACWSAGAINVPIYETSSLAQITMILQQAEVSLVFTENSRLAEAVNSAARDVTHPVKVLSLDLGAIAALMEGGREVAQVQVDQARATLTSDTVATIVYTSGTTGTPKGTPLTHGNFTSLALNGMEWMPEFSKSKNARLLLFLPLAHVYARFLEVFLISGNGVLAHSPNISNLLPDIASFQPSYLLAVPRVLEKIYNSADAQAQGKVKSVIFKRAVRTAVEYSKALDTPAGPDLRLKLRHLLYEQLVFRKITSLLGAHCQFIISGGGPLGERLGHFYRGIGLQVLEGYGLTETSAPCTVNTRDSQKIGTVGPPISSVTIRVNPEGEVLIKGDSVSRGYTNAPQATAESWDADGFFHSGDLGSIDADGHLRITGRRKEIIVTAGGKNVVPASLEDSLRAHPLISQVMVVGEGRPFVGALITLDSEMLPGWLRNHGLPVMDVTQAARNPGVLDSLQKAVDRANQSVSRAESIRKFKVLPFDFTEANGMLTPSMKVRRQIVAQKCAGEIEDIYGSGEAVQAASAEGKEGGPVELARATTNYLKSLLTFRSPEEDEGRKEIG